MYPGLEIYAQFRQLQISPGWTWMDQTDLIQLTYKEDASNILSDNLSESYLGPVTRHYLAKTIHR